MNKVTVVVKDQEENESIVIAQLNDLEDKLTKITNDAKRFF
ncbi:hypothetical protein [Acinetobacter junii]|nr:hypothetical protein [Acinetobacter junii]